VHAQAMAASSEAGAEYEEWARTHAQGTMKLLETADRPYYNRMQWSALGAQQKTALALRRSKKKVGPKHRTEPPPSTAAKKTRTEAPTTSSPQQPRKRVASVSVDEGGNEKETDAHDQSKKSPAGRPSQSTSMKKAKVAPNLLQINNQARVIHDQIHKAALACETCDRARRSAPTGDPEELSSLDKAALDAIKALNLPNTLRLPSYKVAKHHERSVLRMYTLQPRRITFTRGTDGWLCTLCLKEVKLASLAKVKQHLLTSAHLDTLRRTLQHDKLGGARLEDAARIAGEAEVAQATLTRSVQLRSTVSAAQRGYPFTSADWALRLAQSVVSDISGGKTPDPDVIARLRRLPSSQDSAAAAALAEIDADKFSGVIHRLRQGASQADKETSKQLLRLTELCKPTTENSHGPRPPLHLHRTNISRALNREIGPAVDRLTDLKLASCKYVAVMLDESKSTSLTDPCYVGIQFCTPDFQWGMHLVGQTDTSICTTGSSLLDQIKKIFLPRGNLWDKILLGSTDGCPAMRSTRHYAGVHPRTEGKSLLRYLQDELASRRRGHEATSDLNERLMFLHCVAHVLALAFKDACGVLPPHVIPHLRSFHRNFHNQLKQWAELKRVCEELNVELEQTNELLDDPIDDLQFYRVTRFKSLSPTRWKDLLRVVVAIIDKWPALRALRTIRIDSGYGCPSNDEASWDAPKSKRSKDADSGDDLSESEGAGEVEDQGSGSDTESDDSDDSTADDTDSTDINGILQSDKNGGETKWSELGNDRCTGHCGPHPVEDAVPPGTKSRSFLLSDALGVTPLNHLIDSALADLLQTHVDLVTRLETRGQPISHLCARWIRVYHRSLDYGYIEGHGTDGAYGPVYSPAREYYNDTRAGNEPELVKAVDSLAKIFAAALISSSTARLKPYWATLCAFELADPSMKLPEKEDAPSVWDAAKVLCETVNVDYRKFRQQLTTLRARFPDLPTRLQTDCSKNLLRFYHNYAIMGGLDDLEEVRNYAVAVFTFPCATVFIECLFSGMKLNKSKTRSSMADDTCVDVLKARELKRVLTSDDGTPEPALSLDLQSALDHNVTTKPE
jgi:hypothetical protein